MLALMYPRALNSNEALIGDENRLVHLTQIEEYSCVCHDREIEKNSSWSDAQVMFARWLQMEHRPDHLYKIPSHQTRGARLEQMSRKNSKSTGALSLCENSAVRICSVRVSSSHPYKMRSATSQATFTDNRGEIIWNYTVCRSSKNKGLIASLVMEDCPAAAFSRVFSKTHSKNDWTLFSERIQILLCHAVLKFPFSERVVEQLAQRPVRKCTSLFFLRMETSRWRL